MNFKTRLLVTFLTIVLLPLVLTAIAFVSIGGYLMNAQREYGIVNIDYTMMSDPAQTFEQISDEIFTDVKQQIITDKKRLEDTNYLADLNKEIEEIGRAHV